MHFQSAALALFAGAVYAQSSTVAPTPTSSTSTNASSTASSLPQLVSELPTCAIGCFNEAATSVKCGTGDFKCLCEESKRQSFVSSLGPCVVIGNKCSSDDIKKATDVAGNICNYVQDNPDPSQVASASNIVTAAVASASASESPGAGARAEVGLGLLGVAAVAALL